MSYTFATALERLREIAGGQADGYRRLLQTTRDGIDALRSQDHERFEGLLADQVETLRELADLRRERGEALREVGKPAFDDELVALDRELKSLAAEVVRANRVGRFVIQRNGALVEARLGLHRRVGTVPAGREGHVDRLA
jgi:hypothetical protein